MSDNVSSQAADSAAPIRTLTGTVVSNSMQKTIDETTRRRVIQIAYNEANGITPQTITRTREQILAKNSILDIREGNKKAYVERPLEATMAADPVLAFMSRDQIERMISDTERKMKDAAKDLDFITAAQYRDEMLALKKRLK